MLLSPRSAHTCRMDKMHKLFWIAVIGCATTAVAQTPPAGAGSGSVPGAALPPPAPSAPPLPSAGSAPPTRSVSASTLGGPNYMGPEQALERLYQQLQLSAEQQPAWQRYVRELDTATGMMMRERPVAPQADESGAQQFGRVALQLQNRLAAMESIERAARELLAVLSPEQQKVANLGLLSTLPPLLAATPIAGLARPMEDTRGRGESALRQRRGGMGGGMGGGGMRP